MRHIRAQKTERIEAVSLKARKPVVGKKHTLESIEKMQEAQGQKNKVLTDQELEVILGETRARTPTLVSLSKNALTYDERVNLLKRLRDLINKIPRKDKIENEDLGAAFAEYLKGLRAARNLTWSRVFEARHPERGKKKYEADKTDINKRRRELYEENSETVNERRRELYEENNGARGSYPRSTALSAPKAPSLI